ncbi:MAG: UDP-N-acetylglucosamine 1-carboxyvinyltransferase [Gammaproteobacteria bacterium]|nr:UDP-N-acetylglucosamine 1-carboxyvinyltransferase [Gammaproteobacteria bacterium]
MEQFVIQGGLPLNGTLAPSGNKNAALPILAACLLTEEPVILKNVPLIGDIHTLKQLLESIGATITPESDHTWVVQAKSIDDHCPDPSLCKRIRASILLAGPMLARHGKLTLPPPGGDIIGRRRLDTHIIALQSLGAQIKGTNPFRIEATRLHGSDILLDEASVTATENALMASVLAKGTTTLRNAASEPHVQELCRFLNSLGANITGIGSNMLSITGVNSLHGGTHTIGTDYLEVVSFIGATAVTGGSIKITNASPQYLKMAHLVFSKLGVSWTIQDDTIIVPSNQDLKITPDLDNAIPKIDDAPWPGFPADMMSIAIVVATQSHGTILFHEKLFESRLHFVDKLISMGAQIIMCDPHRCIVQGPTKLQAETLESPDIRAGMALLIASLCAKGESTIRNIHQIERGYEDIQNKLTSLGANITRSS